MAVHCRMMLIIALWFYPVYGAVYGPDQNATTGFCPGGDCPSLQNQEETSLLQVKREVLPKIITKCCQKLFEFRPLRAVLPVPEACDCGKPTKECPITKFLPGLGLSGKAPDASMQKQCFSTVTYTDQVVVFYTGYNWPMQGNCPWNPGTALTCDPKDGSFTQGTRKRTQATLANELAQKVGTVLFPDSKLGEDMNKADANRKKGDPKSCAFEDFGLASGAYALYSKMNLEKSAAKQVVLMAVSCDGKSMPLPTSVFCEHELPQLKGIDNIHFVTTYAQFEALEQHTWTTRGTPAFKDKNPNMPPVLTHAQMTCVCTGKVVDKNPCEKTVTGQKTLAQCMR